MFYFIHNYLRDCVKMARPLFITFEGIDGSGKSTQISRLLHAIRDENSPFGGKYSTVWVSREPTKLTESGKTISSAIRQRVVSAEEATDLFIKDRIEHTRNFIRPRLKEGSYVLLDRYDLSTYAYQMTQGIEFEKLYQLHRYDDEGAIIPDITVVFDVPARVALERIAKRNGWVEQFEVPAFQIKLERVQNEAIQLIQKLQPQRKIIRVNSNQSVENVTKEMIEKLTGAVLDE
jgi:dTMP kinase